MKIMGTKNYAEMSKNAANIFAAEIVHNPKIVLGLATGSTPIGMYQELVKKYRKGFISFRDCKSINLDEYCGLGKDDEQSYVSFMNKNLFEQVDIKEENIHIPNGLNENAEEECERYDKLIQTLEGADIQVLGIGNNGHIGFNEPEDEFKSKTRQVDLTESTIEANTRFFDSKEEVPTKAYTMGIKGVMEAKKILLLASGSAKSEAILKMITGPITPSVPASILQLHPDVTIVADEEALEKLRKVAPKTIQNIA
jgi:glucosamine-6-phosphate deaminase